MTSSRSARSIAFRSTMSGVSRAPTFRHDSGALAVSFIAWAAVAGFGSATFCARLPPPHPAASSAIQVVPLMARKLSARFRAFNDPPRALGAARRGAHEEQAEDDLAERDRDAPARGRRGHRRAARLD